MTSVERQRESPLSRLARRGFGDPSAAARLLASEVFGELGRDPLLIEAIGRSADPDLALSSLAALIEACDDAAQLRATVASSKPLRDRLLGVLGVSEAIGSILVRHPEDWHVLEEFEVEDLAHGPDRFTAELLAAVGAAAPRPGRGRTGAGLDGPAPMAQHAPPVASLTGTEAADALRRAYHRALLALTARDVTSVGGSAETGGGARAGHTAGATLSTVAADLADLAAATLEAALAVARAEEPEGAEPVRLAVIGMGKCGARELNYVSDVDVVFVAEPVERADGSGDEEAALRAGTRLASRMMRLCSESTAEGSIWQVDAALRPEGKAGPLVRSLASHAAYYHRWAKTWEFQALLKARPVAGDLALGAAFRGVVEPMVWSAAGRDNFVDDVQAMRRRVVDNAIASLRRAPGTVTVDRELKLGPGGLRDVEFAVQLLQLVHGRTDESLRTLSTLESLDALAHGGYVGRQDATLLADAYRFLRTVEHRIQLFRLERTHTMPEDPTALRRIGRSMGWTTDPAGQLRSAWKSHALEVRRLHEKLFYRPLLSAVARLDGAGVDLPGETDPRRRLSTDAARSRLAALGYADPAGALVNIEALTTGLSRRAAIQRTLLPVLLDWFAEAPDPDAGLLAFRRVSDALGTTPWYLRSLRDEGEAAARLAHVLSSGGYLPDLLMRAPEAVALLSDDAALRVRDRAAVEAEMLALVQRAGSAEQAVAAVRAVRRRELFRIGAADVLGLLGSTGAGPDGGPGTAAEPAAAGDGAPGTPQSIDVIGRALTDVTAATISAALAAVARWRDESRAPNAAARFAVIAMGRFGGAELGYGSDADVLFVYEPTEGAEDRAANTVAFELANELRRLLQLPTADPPLLIDADLRPEGRQGPLVRSLASYAEYYRRWSKVWEAQALLRAAPIAGDADTGARFAALADPLRYPAGGPAEADVREIRRIKARMEAERLPRGADRSLHTKLGPGGLSDVEWVAQLLQLRFADRHPLLRTTATRAALGEASAAGLLDEADRALLDDAWCQTSRLRNAVTIVRGRPDDMVPTGGRELAGVARYLSGSRPHPDTVGLPRASVDGEALLDAHRRRARRARAVFERLFFEEG